MEFKLNIYNGREIEKTYTTDDFILKMGTTEDILKVIDPEKLSFNTNDEKAMLELVKVVIRMSDYVKPIMKEIFVGLTDEEYRRADTKEVATVIFNCVMYIFSQLFSATSRKN